MVRSGHTRKFPHRWVSRNAVDSVLPINESCPIAQKEWRRCTNRSSCVETFFDATQPDFSLVKLRKVASYGNDIRIEYGALNLAMRAVQEADAIEKSYFSRSR